MTIAHAESLVVFTSTNKQTNKQTNKKHFTWKQQLKLKLQTFFFRALILLQGTSQGSLLVSQALST